jgi:hypothetical protein
VKVLLFFVFTSRVLVWTTDADVDVPEPRRHQRTVGGPRQEDEIHQGPISTLDLGSCRHRSENRLHLLEAGIRGAPPGGGNPGVLVGRVEVVGVAAAYAPVSGLKRQPSKNRRKCLRVA